MGYSQFVGEISLDQTEDWEDIGLGSRLAAFGCCAQGYCVQPLYDLCHHAQLTFELYAGYIKHIDLSMMYSCLCLPVSN